MKRYNPSEIEPKWQAVWAEQAAYAAPKLPTNDKTYVSGMFPYPSGAGMHAGHAFSYSIVDAIARWLRAQPLPASSEKPEAKRQGELPF